MVKRCAVCGNIFEGDKTLKSRETCRVCGSFIEFDERENLGSERNAVRQVCGTCGNPIDGKSSVNGHCAVCGSVLRVYEAVDLQPLKAPDLNGDAVNPDFRTVTVISENAGNADGFPDNNLPLTESSEYDSVGTDDKDDSVDDVSIINDIKELTNENNSGRRFRGVSDVKRLSGRNAEDLFKNIIILPAELYKGAVKDPDITFTLGKAAAKPLVLPAPAYGYNQSGFEIFRPYDNFIIKSDSPKSLVLDVTRNAGIYPEGVIRENFRNLKNLAGGSPCGIRLACAHVKSDIIFAESIGADFVELAIDNNGRDILPSMGWLSPVKSLSIAVNTIKRGKLGLSLILYAVPADADNIVKAICLGADACAFDSFDYGSDIPDLLKEYCLAAAHSSIRAFNRDDIAFV